MGKCLLLLGGAIQQVVALKTAKAMGYRTVLCDRAINNPAREFADVFYLESICDKKAILEIAKKEKVDGVISYATDPGVVTASYVATKLKLPTNPYESIEILSNKDLFRKFLKENGFNTPLAKGYSSIKEALKEIKNFKLPVLVKPVDSSGSRGVSLVRDSKELEEKIEYALLYSLKKRFIIEEYIDIIDNQISGDGFSLNGKLEVLCLGRHYFSKMAKNKFVPIATTFPYGLKKDLKEKIEVEVQRLLTKLKMQSCMYNVEIRIDQNDNIYLIEVAPRNGGNFIAQIIEHSMDIKIVEMAIKMALGEEIVLKENKGFKGYWAYFVLKSLKEGRFKKLVVSEEIKKNIVEEYIKAKEGDLVKEFLGGNDALGVLIMKFSSNEEMLAIIKNSNKLLQVEVY